MASPAIFDHEKLDVYQLELKFLTWVTQFLVDMSCPSPTQTLSNTASARMRQVLAQQFEDEDDDEHEDERRPI